MGGSQSCPFCEGTGKLKCEECSNSFMYGIFRHPKNCEDCEGKGAKNNTKVDCPECAGKGYKEIPRIAKYDELGDSVDSIQDSMNISANISKNVEKTPIRERNESSGKYTPIRCNKCDGNDQNCLYCAGKGIRKIRTLKKKKSKKKTCVQCSGKGFKIGYYTCPTCLGKKIFDYVVCQSCKGSTRVDCLACDATGSRFVKRFRDRCSCCSFLWTPENSGERKNLIG